MISLAKTYGPHCWPLLYQTDVRCRSERIPLIRGQLVTSHNAAIISSQPSSFDSSRPWDAAFRECIKSPESKEWWDKEFNLNALLLITRTGQLSSMIDGDALVEASNARVAGLAPRSAPSLDEIYRGPSASSSRAAAPPRGTTASQPKASKQQNQQEKTRKTGTYTGPRIVNGQYMCNRQDFELCTHWNGQNGCNRKGKNNFCGYDGTKVHQCSKCLQPSHGAMTGRCTMVPADFSGKSKGKGSKGKRR